MAFIKECTCAAPLHTIWLISSQSHFHACTRNPDITKLRQIVTKIQFLLTQKAQCACIKQTARPMLKKQRQTRTTTKQQRHQFEKKCMRKMKSAQNQRNRQRKSLANANHQHRHLYCKKKRKKSRSLSMHACLYVILQLNSPSCAVYPARDT